MMLSARWTPITLLVLVACGGGRPAPRAPEAEAIRLVPHVAEQSWYRSVATCGQGPYELELPVAGARWGEDFELRVRTPRRVALHAVILVDDAEVARTAGVFDRTGVAAGDADNTRCIADVRERLTLGRGGGGARTSETPGTPGTPGIRVPNEAAPPPAGTAQLDLDTSLVTTSTTVLTFTIRDRPRPGARLRLRFWSIEPNDLVDVLFGTARIEWRPNVAERDYEAHLSRLAAEEEARRLRLVEAERQRELAWQREQAAIVIAPPRPVKVTAQMEAEWRLERERRAAAELAAYRRREAERQRLALEAEARRREAARRAAIAVALEAERRARRAAFCASHPEDRGCWGAGGLKVHLELEQRRREREDYCASATEDARCWDAETWGRRRSAWNKRVQVALAPPAAPEGPPPAPLAEVTPPRLSVNASWRPGYWQWIDGTWVWLAGMWRVPPEDIAAEQTTTAPAAPPPPQTETVTVAPVRTAVWIGGFWQWSGSSWVWIAGSWQLRPETRVTWRAPEWRPRGNVHVLIPGGWIRIGGR